MPFNFKKLNIPDVILIEPQVFNDERGFFAETYKYPDFEQFGISKRIVQVNHTRSKKGVLRGLHFQKNPMVQGKFVTTVAGKLFDVAVDMRKGSPYYGKWINEVLSSENRKMLYIPEGFAHGFCVLSDTAEVIYYCTNIYSPEYNRGIIWNDQKLNINWPIKNPILSKKDANLPTSEEADNNFIYNEK